MCLLVVLAFLAADRWLSVASIPGMHIVFPTYAEGDCRSRG